MAFSWSPSLTAATKAFVPASSAAASVETQALYSVAASSRAAASPVGAVEVPVAVNGARIPSPTMPGLQAVS